MTNKTDKMTGTVKWFDENKGYGFINPDNKSQDVFVHHSALSSIKDRTIFTGDRISFKVERKEKGLAAIEVKKSDEDNNFLDSFEHGYSSKSQKSKDSIENDKKHNPMKFKDLGLISELLKAVKDAKYEDPTPIQTKAIPFVLKGRDMLACAQTGTGKTAAFALPIIQRLKTQSESKKGKKPKIKVLVLAPTRELAIQISKSFKIYGKYTNLKNVVIYGGVGQNPQVKKLKKGVDIVVATPGRLMDLMNQGYVDFSSIETLILDEGDRMLDMGFIKDIRYIIKRMPKKNRQTLLFSATIPKEIKQFSNSILKNPIEINVSPEKPTLDIIKQSVFFTSKRKKQALLQYLLREREIKKALVFTRTKREANRVVKKLKRKNINAEPIHGNKSQSARQRALKKFRKGKTRVLVATNVAARGIDVDNITHVIQFDLPDVPETYVHRIGRTARAGAGGTAYSFAERSQSQMVRRIEKLIQMRVNIEKNHPYSI